jgi:hypothetical protein
MATLLRGWCKPFTLQTASASSSRNASSTASAAATTSASPSAWTPSGSWPTRRRGSGVGSFETPSCRTKSFRANYECALWRTVFPQRLKTEFFS